MSTSVLDTEPYLDGTGGYGLSAQVGASLSATDCVIQGNHGMGVLASSEASIALETSSVSGTMPNSAYTFALGIAAQLAAHIDAYGVLVDSNAGPGLYVVDLDSGIVCSECTIAANEFAGALAYHGTLLFTSTTFSDNMSNASLGGGVAVYADSADVEMVDCAIGPHEHDAVWLKGEGAYWLAGNTIEGGSGFELRPGVWLAGDGLFATGTQAWDDAQGKGLYVNGNTFSNSDGAGVFLQAATATLDANTWAENAVDVVQQRCEATTALSLDALGGVTTWSLCPNAEKLFDDLDFVTLEIDDTLPE
jgi:hypothetical protein